MTVETLYKENQWKHQENQNRGSIVEFAWLLLNQRLFPTTPELAIDLLSS